MKKADDRLIRIAVCAGAHGVRGRIKIKTFTDDPAMAACYGMLLDEHGSELFAPVLVGTWRHGIIIKADGIDDREAAQALAGQELCIPRSRFPKAEPDEFYHEDLIGLKAVTADGEAMGQVVAVHDFGAGDVLEIRRSKEEWMVPFLEKTVPAVNLEAGQIIIELPVADAGIGDAA